MSMGGKRPIRVLAADDSAVMRGVMRALFQTQRQPSTLPEMELCGIVEDGVECLAAVIRLRPDVVVLDLEMPRMHGLEVLEHLRIDEPGLPVIMCSSYTERGARSTLDALAMGAADYVMKPSEQGDLATAMEALASQLLPKICALAGAGYEVLAGVRGNATRKEIAEAVRAQNLGRAGLSASCGSAGTQVEIVVIGVSTGGPSALEAMLPKLAKDFPVPVMIVQHMPKLFTGALAERLDRICALRVREAHDGAELHAGTIWLAPGDAHMEISEPATGSRSAVRGSEPRLIKLHQQISLNHCKPSVDYLFSSAARIYGAGTLALVMTGMGADGLTGARRVHGAGGTVLVQDAATSAVWGMPGRVFEAGVSQEPLPLTELAAELTRQVNGGRSRRLSGDATAQTMVEAQSMTGLRRDDDTVTAARREATHGLL